jgi:5-methylcytosine-specific restriction enzyme A
MPGGWVKRKRVPCRWCGGEVPKRRLTFCSADCVHQWKLRTDAGYLRAQVFDRDRGVCALCTLDTEALRRDKRKLDYTARRQFEKDWGGRRHLWDADHLVPVVEGGGECDLSNMRTLCLKCHREQTAALRSRLAARVQQVAAEVVMPGKKAHKPRDVQGAGTKGTKKQAGHARGSSAQTEGQFSGDGMGRRGQYTGAGEAPIMKK